jgi:hypothetical protein
VSHVTLWRWAMVVGEQTLPLAVLFGLVCFARNCRRKVVDVSAVQFSVTTMDSTSPVSRQMAE